MANGGGETAAHRELKRRALMWAQAHGFVVCATEVALPRSRFRADVAACVVPKGGAAPGECAVFECKQARSDLLRDTARERATLERLLAVGVRRRELEQMLGLHLPSLRRGESLFAECDAYDLDAVRHDGLKAVRREEALLQRKLFGRTKLDKIRRYRCADRCYLVCLPDVLARHEVPEDWGLLIQAGDGLELVRAPARHEVGDAARIAMLHAVALAAARRVNVEFGIERDEVEAARRTVVPY